MGQMFHQLGILASPDVVEVSAGDFTTGYVGQSANKTNEIFESALGQVLFIDEAYRYEQLAHYSTPRQLRSPFAMLVCNMQRMFCLTAVTAVGPTTTDNCMRKSVRPLLCRLNPGALGRTGGSFMSEVRPIHSL